MRVCVYQCANPHIRHTASEPPVARAGGQKGLLQLLHVEVEASKRPGAHQKIFIATIASSRQIGHWRVAAINASAHPAQRRASLLHSMWPMAARTSFCVSQCLVLDVACVVRTPARPRIQLPNLETVHLRALARAAPSRLAPAALVLASVLNDSICSIGYICMFCVW